MSLPPPFLFVPLAVHYSTSFHRMPEALDGPQGSQATLSRDRAVSSWRLCACTCRCVQVSVQDSLHSPEHKCHVGVFTAVFSRA